MEWICSTLRLFVFDPRYQRVRLGTALGIYFLVLILGSVPGARQEVGKFASGLVLHSLTYGFITAMLFGGLGKVRVRIAFLCLTIVAAMGALDEYVQGFFPYRSANIADWSVDILASMITLAALLLFSWVGTSCGKHPRAAKTS